MQTFKLGSRLRDKVSGFVGIASSRIEYLSGCVQYCLVPGVDKDGKYVDGHYIDVQRLEVVDEGVSIDPTETGGPDHRGEAPPVR